MNYALVNRKAYKYCDKHNCQDFAILSLVPIHMVSAVNYILRYLTPPHLFSRLRIDYHVYNISSAPALTYSEKNASLIRDI